LTVIHSSSALAYLQQFRSLLHYGVIDRDSNDKIKSVLMRALNDLELWRRTSPAADADCMYWTAIAFAFLCGREKVPTLLRNNSKPDASDGQKKRHELKRYLHLFEEVNDPRSKFTQKSKCFLALLYLSMDWNPMYALPLSRPEVRTLLLNLFKLVNLGIISYSFPFDIDAVNLFIDLMHHFDLEDTRFSEKGTKKVTHIEVIR
jgi:hypothetical protein